MQPTLVGIAGFPDGGSLNGATFAAFDTATAQDLFLDGEDAYNDVWVTAEDGVSQEELRDAVEPVLPDGIEAVTGDAAADEAASDLLEAISFITTFLLIFAGIALVVGAFLIVNTFSILVAQRSRELALLRALGASRRQVTRSVLLEAFVLGRPRLDDRARARRAARDAAARAVRAVRPRPVGAAADLLPADRRGVVRRRGRGHHGRGLPAGPADVADRAGAGHARRHRAAGVVAAPTAAARRRRSAWSAPCLLALGLFTDVPRAGWFVGAGILLDAARRQPRRAR